MALLYLFVVRDENDSAHILRMVSEDARAAVCVGNESRQMIDPSRQPVFMNRQQFS